jgi:uncharacterized protein (TIGR03083 family)
MDLTRDETIDGMRHAYESFAELVGSLTDAEWHAVSRCTGWEVRDVAGHVIGLAEDVAAGVPGSRNAEQEAASIRVLTPSDAAEHLRIAIAGVEPLAAALAEDGLWNAPSPLEGTTMGEGVLLLWFDTFVHADDIRAATGRAHDDGPGLVAALAYVEAELRRQGWGPARVAITDLGTDVALEVGTPAPGAPDHRAPAYELLLAATGRADAAALGLPDDVNIFAS